MVKKIHYLLKCPTYTALRATMIRDLATYLPQANDQYTSRNANKQKILLNNLIMGTGSIQDDINIFNVVSAYIENTRRFVFRENN